MQDAERCRADHPDRLRPLHGAVPLPGLLAPEIRGPAVTRTWLVFFLVIAGSCLASEEAAAAIRARAQVGELILEAPLEQEARVQELASMAAIILPRLQANLGTAPAAPFRVLLIPAGRLGDPEIARLDEAAPTWAAGFRG